MMDVQYTPSAQTGSLVNYHQICGVFKCFRCDFKCTNTLELKQHYQIHRFETPFMCFQCGYNGNNAEDFKNHSITHFEESYFKCPKCDYKAEHRQKITDHVRYTHKQICYCGVQFKFRNKFMLHLLQKPECRNEVDLDEEMTSKYESFAIKNQQHLIRQVNKKDIKSDVDNDEHVVLQASPIDPMDVGMKPEMCVCQICFFIFKTPTELKDHTACEHTAGAYVCKQCPFQATNESELSKHELGHVDKIFLCTECHFIFSTSESLKKHIETHKTPDDEIDYVCYICEKSFRSEKSVKLHMNHHSLVKHQCPICSVILKSMSGLKNHMNTHENKPKGKFCCSKCPKICMTLTGLKQHTATHTTKGFHWCPFCNFKTKVRAELRKHFRSLTHLKENFMKDFEELFICCKCSYESSTEEELEGHWFEEHNEGHLDCSECHESFATTDALKEHLICHFKPYTCEECEESFCTESILAKHSFIHRPEIVLECPICDSTDFETLEELKQHAMVHYTERRPSGLTTHKKTIAPRSKRAKKATFKVRFTKPH